MQKDTTTQWDLVAASVEEANINYHGLTGKNATNMRGRSKVTFKKAVRNHLEGMGLEEENIENDVRLTWLRKVAGDDTAMGTGS